MAKIEDVVDRLVEQTDNNRVNWLPGVRSNTVIAAIGNMGVSISSPSEADLGSAMALRITDQNGEIIQVLYADRVDRPHVHVKLERIYSKAREIVSGNDPRLDELLEELERV